VPTAVGSASQHDDRAGDGHGQAARASRRQELADQRDQAAFIQAVAPLDVDHQEVVGATQVMPDACGSRGDGRLARERAGQ
jgi:hypothetical protein